MVTTLLFLFERDVEKGATVSRCQSMASFINFGTKRLGSGVTGYFCSVHLNGTICVIVAKIHRHFHLFGYGE